MPPHKENGFPGESDQRFEEEMMPSPHKVFYDFGYFPTHFMGFPILIPEPDKYVTKKRKKEI